jgi:hypothetical protein
MAGWLVDRHSGTLSFLSRGVQHRAQPGAERGRMASRAGRFALPCCAAATLATHKGFHALAVYEGGFREPTDPSAAYRPRRQTDAQQDARPTTRPSATDLMRV